MRETELRRLYDEQGRPLADSVILRETETPPPAPPVLVQLPPALDEDAVRHGAQLAAQPLWVLGFVYLFLPAIAVAAAFAWATSR